MLHVRSAAQNLGPILKLQTCVASCSGTAPAAGIPIPCFLEPSQAALFLTPILWSMHRALGSAMAKPQVLPRHGPACPRLNM